MIFKMIKLSSMLAFASLAHGAALHEGPGLSGGGSDLNVDPFSITCQVAGKKVVEFDVQNLEPQSFTFTEKDYTQSKGTDHYQVMILPQSKISAQSKQQYKLRLVMFTRSDSLRLRQESIVPSSGESNQMSLDANFVAQGSDINRYIVNIALQILCKETEIHP